MQQRHHASADALVTAELALILFSKARSQQLDSLQALEQQLNGYHRQHFSRIRCSPRLSASITEVRGAPPS